MDDFLKAVKTVRVASEDKPDPALTAVSTTQKRQERSPQALPKAVSQHGPTRSNGAKHPVKAQTAEEALRILRSQPDTETLLNILRQLSSYNIYQEANVCLQSTGPVKAQIVNCLLDTTIPTFWAALNDNDKGDLLRCLTNVAGVNALIAKICLLSVSKTKTSGAESTLQVEELLDVVHRLFHGDDFVLKLWENLDTTTTVKRDLAWKEIVNVLGSGKIIATVAQAEDAIKAQEDRGSRRSSWLSVGSEYASWLGRNIAQMYILHSTNEVEKVFRDAAHLFSRSLNLGYAQPLIKELVPALVRYDAHSGLSPSSFDAIAEYLPSYSKRQFLEQTLRWLSDLTPSTDSESSQTSAAQESEISAIAALLRELIGESNAMQQHLLTILSDPAQSSSLSYAVRRACIASLFSASPDSLQTLLEKLMATFSDRLFIDHAPLLQQESLAQTLLLTAGYLHRQNPIALLMIARSGGHMQGTSNRLDASSQRTRWLGMVVATAVSSLVDKEGVRMDFGVEEVRTEEAEWYLRLVGMIDEVGTLKDFEALLKKGDVVVKSTKKPQQKKKAGAEVMPTLNGKPVFGPLRPPIPAQTEIVGERVTEVLDSEEEDSDDDLKPYAKPDSDPEDSDEDATLVNRNKPRPPVYIRDLMTLLHDDKDHDRFQMGLQHAAKLIRRKTGFGCEVRDHAEEILRLLCNLQDPFDTDDFEELRLQAMIAVLLSDVPTLAPWLSRQAFGGEYSLAQRCVMLTTLGLTGRELAGHKNEDELNPALGDTSFPSKRLPQRLHTLYASAPAKRLEAASKEMEEQLIKPLALHAADQTTAHLNSVKVRTFSSRMEVERTKRKPAPNALAKIFSTAFFFPLANRYQQEIAAYGSGSVFSSSAFLLVTFLKTLALLLHASGPATMGLTEVTMEFWDLLLSLRVRAAGDVTVLEAVLFAFLTLLEVNTSTETGARRLVEERGKQLMETQQWVEVVFERTGASGLIVEDEGRGEEAKVRTLSAGVLVKMREVVEAYQKQVFGRVIE